MLAYRILQELWYYFVDTNKNKTRMVYYINIVIQVSCMASFIFLSIMDIYPSEYKKTISGNRSVYVEALAIFAFIVLDCYYWLFETEILGYYDELENEILMQ